jgi:DNA-binding Lrp family transcriptional regulator
LDQRILAVLRDDGRISMARLAEAVHTSRASAYVRLNRLREVGALLGFSAVVNPARIGTGVAALVLISANRRGRLRWMRWREQLEKIPAVEYAAMVTGETDVVVLLRVRDQEELRRVLLEQVQALEHVGTTHTLMVLDEIVHRPYVVPDGGPPL